MNEKKRKVFLQLDIDEALDEWGRYLVLVLLFFIFSPNSPFLLSSVFSHMATPTPLLSGTVHIILFLSGRCVAEAFQALTSGVLDNSTFIGRGVFGLVEGSSMTGKVMAVAGCVIALPAMVKRVDNRQL